MEVGVLAVRYAKALYDYAHEKGVAEELYVISQMILDSFVSSPTFSRTIEDPLLPKDEKISLMLTSSGLKIDDQAISDDLHQNNLVYDVLKRYFTLLINNRREGYLYSSIRYYQQIYRKKMNIAVAKIITAVELDNQMEEKILSKASTLLHKQIELKKIVDTKIDGGFILDIDDYRIDASVSTQLKRIKNKLINKNRRIV